MSLVLGAVLTVLLAAPPPEEVRAAARRVLEDETYQTRLPGERTAPDAGLSAPREPVQRPPPRDERSPEPRRDAAPAPRPVEPPEPRRYDGPSDGAGVGAAVFWVVAAVVVLLLVGWLVAELRGKPRDVRPAAAAVGGAPPPRAAVDRPLSAAEALAMQGRFGAAIHELLLQTIAELSRTTPRPPPASHTAREIARDAPMPEEARRALAELVLASEVAHFGGRDPGASEWEACQARYGQFARAYVGAAA